MNPSEQSKYEKAVEAGLIVAPTIPNAEPMPALIKAASGLNSSDVLIEMRAQERD